MRYFAKLGKLEASCPTSPEARRPFVIYSNLSPTTSILARRRSLACIGEMYVADERFRRNIDNAGGEGTAAFTAQAIHAYCRK